MIVPGDGPCPKKLCTLVVALRRWLADAMKNDAGVSRIEETSKAVEGDVAILLKNGKPYHAVILAGPPANGRAKYYAHTNDRCGASDDPSLDLAGALVYHFE